MIYNSTLPRRYYALSDFMHPEDGLKEVYEALVEKYKGSEEIPLDDEAEKLYGKWSSLEPEKMKHGIWRGIL